MHTGIFRHHRAFVGVLATVLITASLPVMAQVWSERQHNASCMQNAIRQRDEANIAAYSEYNASMNAALRLRMSAQVRAWSNPNPVQRQQEINASEQEFHRSSNEANVQLNTSRERIRRQFAADERNCMVNPPPPWWASSSRSSNSGCFNSCAPAPSGCYYQNQRYDQNGCVLDCGTMSCQWNGNSSSRSSQCFNSCAPAPYGCYYINQRYQNGCVMDCGQLVCQRPSSSSRSSQCLNSCAPPPFGCYYINQRYENGCVMDCGNLVCNRPSSSSSAMACGPYGSCRYGETCPPGTICSGIPAYGCYPYGCPYPK